MKVQKQVIVTGEEYIAEAFDSPAGVDLVTYPDSDECVTPEGGDGFVIEYDADREDEVMGWFETWAESLGYELEWSDYSPVC